MKKTILTIAIALISICGYSQMEFKNADAQYVKSSIDPHTSPVGDSIQVDSISFKVNCWFKIKNNPYVVDSTHVWCWFVQINVTFIGDAKESQLINMSNKYCQIYRKKEYPDIE